MRIPTDATQDVKIAIRDIIQEINGLKSQYVQLPGSRITGAQDANTNTGLVTLQQLNSYYTGLSSAISALNEVIVKLKTDNGLI